MEKITNQTHPKETFLYAISRTLERTSYYGFRAMIVLYMIDGIFEMESKEALSVYGWITASLIFSRIIGAILGDLIIGNKKAIILGGIIQSLGAFIICIPSTTGLYVGLFFIILGSGLYTPNIISNFGKLYLNKTKLLDAGFTIFYLAVNLGAFIGVATIAYIGEEYGWNIGFIIAGIVMLLSIIPILISKEKKIEVAVDNSITISQRIINISIAIVIVGIFWAIYEIRYYGFFDLQIKLSEISTLNIPRSMWQSSNTIFLLPITILAIILWTLYYNNQFFKLTIGFIFGALSFGILLLIPEIPSEKDIVLYFLSLLFLSISEIHIAPIIYSILTQFTKPKYLAILISLAFIPIRIFSAILVLFNDKFYENPVFASKFGMIAMVICSIGLITFTIWNKKITYNNGHS